MLWITLEVGVKTTVGFNRDDGSEIEFASFQLRFTPSMGAMRESRWW